MPTYVYACTNPDCAHQFEAVQSFTDDALTVCPVCGHRLRKVFGSVGVVFKGSGFYRNDSREKSAAGAKSSAPSSDKANGASSDGGTSDSSSAKSDTASTSTAESSATSGSSRSGSTSESAGSSGSGSASKTSSDKSAASKS